MPCSRKSRAALWIILSRASVWRGIMQSIIVRGTMTRIMEPTTVTVERDGHVLLMGLDRPAKRNAFTLEMLADLSRAYALLEDDDDLRAGVLFAHGEHFTGGLDLVDVGPALAAGQTPFPDDGRDP